MEAKENINFFFEKGFLIDEKSTSFIESIDLNTREKFYDFLIKNGDEASFIDETLILKFKEQFVELNLSQKPIANNNSQSNLKVVFTYTGDSKKREIMDFVRYFNHRYKSIERILANRQELKNLMSISRVLKKTDKEETSIIGMVSEINITKNNNLQITVEDPTGEIRVIINKNRPELFSAAKDLCLDEIIGINGSFGKGIIFANGICWPEIPLNKELKKGHTEGYAVFLSDIHVGSKQFLEEEFLRFVKWINGETGSPEQRKVSSLVKYVFIVGDLVDGVGIYPSQEKDLLIKDIFDQYRKCAELISMIPKHIKIIICPGNHDAMRISEPQPPLYSDYAADFHKMENVTLVSNPAMLNIESTENFPGFDVLLYHGYSFDYFVANVDSLRQGGGYDRADLLMKYLLQRRHLAPSHQATLYIPDDKSDPLVIGKIPDFFISGHIHKCSVANYKNITLICGSCWQSKTDFQEKVGHNPEPCRVPVINLLTRDVKILKFM